MRNVQGYTRASPWYILEVTCTNNMSTVLLYNGLCTSNMFMVLQVVVLWLYMSSKFCFVIYSVFVYKNTFEYKNIFYGGMRWVNQHSMQIVVFTYFQLPTFLFSGNYIFPSFAFQHQHLS